MLAWFCYLQGVTCSTYGLPKTPHTHFADIDFKLRGFQLYLSSGAPTPQTFVPRVQRCSGFSSFPDRLLGTKRGAHALPTDFRTFPSYRLAAPAQSVFCDPPASAERSQPSEAVFCSPVATVPLRTTATGSTLPTCSSSASSSRPSHCVSHHGGRLFRTRCPPVTCQQYKNLNYDPAIPCAFTPLQVRFRTFGINAIGALLCQLLVKLGLPDIRSLPSGL
jgi:hypothetical protein